MTSTSEDRTWLSWYTGLFAMGVGMLIALLLRGDWMLAVGTGLLASISGLRALSYRDKVNGDD
jgi:hypothetical protein